MSLEFPNPCRSFELGKNRVQFWGYDNVNEVSFFVEANALLKMCPGINNAEDGLLQAFDSKHKRIHEIACRVYSKNRGKSCSYTLTAKEF